MLLKNGALGNVAKNVALIKERTIDFIIENWYNPNNK